MKNNLWIRALSGLVYVLLAIGSAISGAEGFLFFVTLIAFICQTEFYTLTFRDSSLKYILSLPSLFVLVYHALHLISPDLLFEFDWIFGILFLTGLILSIFVPNGQSLWQQMVIGNVYVVVPFLCFQWLPFASGEFQYSNILLVYGLVWSSDTFAYLSGRAFGNRLLAPSISPGKTWEGFLGGLLGTELTAIAVAYFVPGMDIFFCAGTALVIGFTAPLGDLVESRLKRQAGVKDSGTIMPGHGGLLDRFDSILLAVPSFTVFYILFKHYFH